MNTTGEERYVVNNGMCTDGGLICGFLSSLFFQRIFSFQK